MNDFNNNFCLLNRLICERAIDLTATTCDPIEEKRFQWTTFNSLNMWFNGYDQVLLDLGFANKIMRENGVKN